MELFRVLSFGSPAMIGLFKSRGMPTIITYPLTMTPDLCDHLGTRAFGPQVGWMTKPIRERISVPSFPGPCKREAGSSWRTVFATRIYHVPEYPVITRPMNLYTQP
jgi:hypothetical protein